MLCSCKGALHSTLGVLGASIVMGKKRSSIGREQASKPKKSVDNRTNDSKDPEKHYLAVPMDEEDFPRGSSSILTPLEMRSVQERAKQDVLFSTDPVPSEQRKSLKTKRKQKDILESSPAPKKSRKSVGKMVPSMKNLKPGTLLLGVVKDLHDLEATVSLPFNMQCVVRHSDISDPITVAAQSEVDHETEAEEDTSVLPEMCHLFFVGQFVMCQVVEKKEKRVTVTLNPRLINEGLSSNSIFQGMVLAGWVESVEDHGLLISFGIEGCKGFLRKAAAQEYSRGHLRGHHIQVGQVLTFLLTSVSNPKALGVSINPVDVNKSLTRPNDVYSFNTILPGSLVMANVDETHSDSISVKLLGGFEGSVSYRHLPGTAADPTTCQLKSKLRARVVWVNREDKFIGLSLKAPTVLGTGFQCGELELGSTIDDAQVVYQDGKHALVLDLGSGHTGFAPISMVYEERKEKFEKQHKVGSRHSCRVISFNLVDCTAIVSLKQSVLEEEFLCYKDLRPGSIVTGKIANFGTYGMVVQVNQYIHGLCPSLHLADVRLKHPEKKLKKGSDVQCRVLSVEPDRQRVYLTHKKTLVDSSLPVLSSYDQARPGGVHHGFIRNIYASSCIVEFFNHVRGKVYRSDLGIPVDADPKACLKVGQVVVCRVLSCEPSEEKLQLSLEVGSDAVVEALVTGEVVDLAVEAISPEGITLRSQGREAAYLPVAHLSDYTELCEPLLLQHQSRLEAAVTRGEQYTLKGLLVVCHKLPIRHALVTLKESLLKEVKSHQAVLDFDSLRPGLVLTGFIRSSAVFGCFVEFMGNLVGLSPNKYLKDEFISDGSDVYKVGQTVRAKVVDMDSERHRFIVSLCCSELRHSNTGDAVANGDWREILVDQLKRYLRQKGEAEPGMTTHPIGAVRRATITAVDDDGKLVRLTLEDGTPAIAAAATGSGLSFDPGEDVEVTVVDLGSPLPVSLNTKLLDAAQPVTKAHKKKKKKQKSVEAEATEKCLSPLEVPLNSKLVVTFEYVSPYHGVCSVSSLHGQGLVYAVFDSGQWGVHPLSMPFLKAGRTAQGIVSHSGDESTMGLPVVTVMETGQSRAMPMQSVMSKPAGIDVGDVVHAVVKGVTESQLTVESGRFKGRVHITMVTDNPSSEDSPLSAYKPSDIIKVRVLKIRQAPGHKAALELCSMEKLCSEGAGRCTEEQCEALLSPALKKGHSQWGYIKLVTHKGLTVQLAPTVMGHVPAQLASEDTDVMEALPLYFKEGQGVWCTVVSRPKGERGTVKLSLIDIPKSPKTGDIVAAVVTNVLPELGLYVSMATLYEGRVHVTDISDRFRKNPTARFKKGDFVRCAVIGKAEGHFLLSLRQSRLGGADTPTDPEVESLEDLSSGDIVRGFVKASSKHGVFVWLGRGVCGRVKFANLADGFVEKPLELLSIGDVVKAKVLDVGEAAVGHVELSIRLSHVDPKAAREKYKEFAKGKWKEEKDLKKREREGKVSEVATAEEGRAVGEVGSDDDSVVSDGGLESVESESESESEVVLQPRASRLDVGAFKWDLTDSDREEDVAEEESGGEGQRTTEGPPSKRSKRQKKAAMRLEEQDLYETELALLDSERPLETADDFERLVVSSPNSSSAWIHYMLHCLTAAEVDKARAVGQRALANIAYDKETDKLNVWVALLNLENMFGTPETLTSTFQQALQHNDPERVYWKMIGIYTKSGKTDMADSLYKSVIKKFSFQPKVWISYLEFLMKGGRREAARAVMERSFKSLQKAQHVEVVVKFAEFEYKHGDPSRGQTLLESVIANYPKRLDVWSRYFDLLIKQGDKDATRLVFERAIQLSLSARKMKFFFKRYLDFEQEWGTAATVQAVRGKAEEFVDREHIELDDL